MQLCDASLQWHMSMHIPIVKLSDMLVKMKIGHRIVQIKDTPFGRFNSMHTYLIIWDKKKMTQDRDGIQ